MGIVIRQSFWISVISYIGVVLGYVNLLYLYPRFLEPDQIGLLRIVQDAALLFAAFAQAGLPQTIVRYFPRYGIDPKESQKFVNLIFVLALGAFFIFSILFLLLKSNIIHFFGDSGEQIGDYLILIMWLTLIMTLISITDAWSRALLKVTTANFLREIGLRVMQAILILFYFLDIISFNSFLILTVLSYLLNLSILLLYLRSIGEFRFQFSILQLPGKTIREILRFCLLSLAGTGALLTIIKIDSLMVTALLDDGLLKNAIYTTAVYMATVIEIPKRAISQSTTTLLSRSFEKNDLREIAALYKKTTINQFIIGSLLFIGIWANLDSVYLIMPKGEIYSAGYMVVLIFGGVKIIDMVFGPNSEILVLSKYYGFHTAALIVMILISISLNLILIPMYGIMGAAIATAITYLLFNICKFVFIYIKLGIQPFTVGCIIVLIISSVVVLINTFLPSLPNVFLDITYRSIIITILFGALVLITRSSEEINMLYRKIITMIKSVWK